MMLFWKQKCNKTLIKAGQTDHNFSASSFGLYCLTTGLSTCLLIGSICSSVYLPCTFSSAALHVHWNCLNSTNTTLCLPCSNCITCVFMSFLASKPSALLYQPSLFACLSVCLSVCLTDSTPSCLSPCRHQSSVKYNLDIEQQLQ